jgi:hypothetical protein
MKASPKKLTARKLLVASVGVATINYVAIACNGLTDSPTNPPTSGNLPAPQPTETAPPTSGNLPAPPPVDVYQPPPTSGNLPSPVPLDAGRDADADAGS